MGELVTTLLGTPIPTILVIGGIIFLFISIFPIKKISGSKPSQGQRISSTLIGIILLLGGISLYLPVFQTELPVSTETKTPTLPTNTSAVLPIDTQPIPFTPIVGEGKIAISEVMSVPCSFAFSGPNKNEYVEIYNYGTGDVNVNGWWIATNANGQGMPDEIVSWDAVNPSVDMGEDVITDTTIIPPNSYAVILSPLYYIDDGKYSLPYRFPKGTVLLSLGNSEYLGLDSISLLGNSLPYSVLVLYQGTQDFMNEVISTYGAPSYGSSPHNIQSERQDNFPFPINDCNSVERIVLSSPDNKNNWRIVENGNPGAGDYYP